MIAYIWRNGALGSALLAVVVAAVVTACYRARRDSGPRRTLAVAVTALTVTLILSLTLARYGWPRTLSLHEAVHWTPGGWQRFGAGVGHEEEISLNVALFVPAAIALALLLRRPLATFTALVALSAVTEFLQGLLGLGMADLSDLLANGLGAFVGTAVGVAVLAVADRQARRQRILALSGLTVVAVVLVAAIPPLAHRHLDDEVTTVREQFSGKTLADYEQWTRQGTAGERAFRVGDLYADGTRAEGDDVTVRYPVSFLGVTQCVEATWTATGVTVTGQAGADCTAFWG
ncbi:MAG: VanZ family protein [Nocardioidaceae bacterium]